MLHREPGAEATVFQRYVERQRCRRLGLTTRLSRKSQAISLSHPGDSGTAPGGDRWAPAEAARPRVRPSIPSISGGDTQGACPGTVTVA